DSDKGGVFAVEPAEGGEGRQSYLTNTNILRTRFQTEDGVFDVIDFAPRYVRGDVYHKPIMLVRIIEPVEGNPLVRVRCQPTGDYGRMDLPAILGGDVIIFRNGRHQYTLMTDLPRSYILEERAVVLTRRQYLVFAYGET